MTKGSDKGSKKGPGAKAPVGASSSAKGKTKTTANPWLKDVLYNKDGVPEITQMGNPVLHKQAQAVDIDKIDSPEIKAVIDCMIKALESQDDGIGIAAPQIGVPLRIFIVAGFVLDRIEAHKAKLANKTLNKDKKNLHQIFINPAIVKMSKEKRWMDGEGCLSVRWLYGKVERSTKVTLRAYNEKGQIIERGASGIMAHIFQHEADHLDGILFIDKAKDVQEFDPAEIRKEAKAAKKARESK